MKINFKLTQLDKNNALSYEATKLVNVGESGEIQDVAKEMAEFINDCFELDRKNKELGWNSGVSLRLSKDTFFDIQALGDYADVATSFKLGKFGKFAKNASAEKMESFLKNNIAHNYKHGGGAVTVRK